MGLVPLKGNSRLPSYANISRISNDGSKFSTRRCGKTVCFWRRCWKIAQRLSTPNGTTVGTPTSTTRWRFCATWCANKLFGKTDFEVFPREIAQQWRTNDLNAMTTGKLTVSEETIASPRGERLVLSKKVPLTSTNGEVEGICGISTDITDLRRIELALREAVTKLEGERDSKLTNVEAIMAAIAHEVRQPLTAIAANGSAARRFIARCRPTLTR